jgi:hypothetical protein
MDVIEKDLGAAKLDVKLENKQLIIEVTYAIDAVGASAKVTVDAHLLLQKIKDLIPGNIDNVVIDILETQVP